MRSRTNTRRNASLDARNYNHRTEARRGVGRIFSVAIVLLLVMSIGMIVVGMDNNGTRTNAATRTTEHTITVDGQFNDWATDEDLGSDNSIEWYLTWDSSNLYVGVKNNTGSNQANQDIWIYIDNDSGATGSPDAYTISGNTTHFGNGFKANWGFIYIYKSSPYWNLKKWNATGSKWDDNQPYNGGQPATTVNGTEIKIPWSDISVNYTSHPQIRVVLFYQTDSNGWVWSIAPVTTDNQNAHGVGTTISDYFVYTLENGISPNSSNNIVPELSPTFIVLLAFTAAVPIIIRRKRYE